MNQKINELTRTARVFMLFLLFVSGTIGVFAQQRQISGKVTDQQGIPMPGVSVVVQGTTTGTVTDADGSFVLGIPADAGTLQFSFVGMQAQEVEIGTRTTFSVVMQEENIGLEEVVA